MMDFATLLHECAPNIGPTTAMAVMHVESGFRPNVIGYKVVAPNGAVMTLQRQPVNAQEAASWADWLLSRGYKFDAGIGQINSVNFARLGLTSQNVFDPCTNIRALAQILSEGYTRAVAKFGEGQQALYAAISAYQSGNFTTGFSTGYVTKVVAHARGTMPAGIMPPLTNAHHLKVTQPIKKPRTEQSQNPYAVSSALPGFRKGWDTPRPWGVQ